jgi:hypothetical protein
MPIQDLRTPLRSTADQALRICTASSFVFADPDGNRIDIEQPIARTA